MRRYGYVADRQLPRWPCSRLFRILKASCALPLSMLGIVGTALLTGCGGGAIGSQNPQSINVQIPPGSVMPTAVATQVGTGAWKAATLQNGQLTIDIPSDTQNYAYAYVCPAFPQTTNANNGTATTMGTIEYISEQSVEDGTSLTFNACQNPNPSTSTSPPPPSPQINTVSLNVDATAIPNTASVVTYSSLSVGTVSVPGGSFGGAYSISGNKGTFTMGMNSGTTDIAVVAYDQNYNPLATYILYSQTIPGPLNGGNPIVFTASDETVPVTVTDQNVPSGWGNDFLNVTFLTSGNRAEFSISSLGLSGSTNLYYAVPASQQKSGSSYTVFAAASSANTNANVSGGVVVDITSPNPVTTIAFPAPFPASDGISTTAAWPTFNVAYPGFSNPSLTTTIWNADISWPGNQYNQPPPQNSYSLEITATPTYMNGATTLPVPDLSSIPGFMAPPSAGSNVQWSVTVNGQNYPNGSPAPNYPEYSFAQIFGSYTSQ